jgi:Pyridoxamine 5'-phosphate oxidase
LRSPLRRPLAYNPGAVARWSEVEREAPELAARAQALFDAKTHKTLATLRKDGSPRISGIELEFRDGDVWFGSMWQAVKALDLQRDPRYAIHSGSDDPDDWNGDAKIAGRAEEMTDPELVSEMNAEAPPGPSHLFRLDVTELSVVALDDPRKHLVIESWHEGRGVTKRQR